MTNVVPLFIPRSNRAAQIRSWFVEQGMEPAGHVAAVSVAITTDGQINTRGCGIEPEHAAVILDELKGLVARLEVFVADEAPDLLVQTSSHQALPVNVIPLRH